MEFFISKVGPALHGAQTSHISHDRVKDLPAHIPCTISMEASTKIPSLQSYRKTIHLKYVKERCE